MSASIANPPLIAQLLRRYLLSNLKGRRRLTCFLAGRLKSLQAVPIAIADWTPVYIDLRYADMHKWLIGHPWSSSPREPEEQAIMRRFVRSGDIVFDIGANIGLHAALLSRLVGETGRVVAFEPNLELIPSLQKTIAQMNNAVLYPYALSDEATSSVLFVPLHSPDVGSLGDWTQDEYGSVHTIACQQQRLDDLIEAEALPHPDFIKCDVEGAELRVFQGAVETLNRVDAPIVLFEANVHTVRGLGVDTWAAMKFLVDLPMPQYRVFEVRSGGELSEEILLEQGGSNLLAIPASKLG